MDQAGISATQNDRWYSDEASMQRVESSNEFENKESAERWLDIKWADKVVMMGGVDDVEDDLFFEKLDAAVHEFLVEHQYQMRSTRRGGGEAAKASGVCGFETDVALSRAAGTALQVVIRTDCRLTRVAGKSREDVKQNREMARHEWSNSKSTQMVYTKTLQSGIDAGMRRRKQG
ncbi:hypothetical protein H2203_007826 [Taxawa tesnikishii (nom. ined.)]|nr:hypothetical protein H2203_007826 [Dothideales sp. JES 119]